MTKEKKEKTYSSDHVQVIRIAQGEKFEHGYMGMVRFKERSFFGYRLAIVEKVKGNCTLYRIWNPNENDHDVIISTQPTSSKGKYRGNSFVTDVMTLKQALPLLSRGIREDERVEGNSEFSAKALKLINYDIAGQILDTYFKSPKFADKYHSYESQQGELGL
jgi:hypothetical protein